MKRRGRRRGRSADRTVHCQVHHEDTTDHDDDDDGDDDDDDSGGGGGDDDARVLRIVHLSDTHGDEDLLDVPAGDVLIHSGDFFHWRQSYDFNADIDRLNKFFAKQPHRHKVKMSNFKTFIGGSVCREFESEAPPAAEVLDRVTCSREQFNQSINEFI